MTNDEKIVQLTEFAREFREHFGTVHGVTSDFFDAWLSLSPEDLPGWVEKVKAAYQAVYDWLSVRMSHS